ncbi:MAG: FAD-dependent monooxygenase [Pseudomonadota bacterium]
MTADFDIAICGAGPVGLATAALLVQRGTAAQRVALIDAKTLAQASVDPRSIALSYGSRQILEQIGAWPSMRESVTAIEQIHVSRRGHFGRSLIDCKDHQLPALGYVTRYGVLVNALAGACERLAIQAIRPAQVLGCEEDIEAVRLQIAQGDEVQDKPRSLSASIMVQAEGGLFSQQSAKTLQRDYQQTAVIAYVHAGAPIAQRAYERFTDEGPLALLPQDDGYALVWCVKPATAAALLALDDTAFLAELGHAFGSRLGRFNRSSKRLSYPLGLNAHPTSGTRTVAIGNAAQTLHPVAGQGFNLGLRDATVLARLLAHDATPGALQQFNEIRQGDRKLTLRLTDTMARIFTSTPQTAGMFGMQNLLGLSLGLIDTITPARHVLAELMMYGRR